MTQRRLPVKQLVILSICRFAEPIALTSVFPYLPEMIQSFGVSDADIAKWAGLTSASFSICQAFTGLPWGAASDTFGRKPMILLGLFNTMWTMLLFGFSTSLPMAMTARALQGLGNGNVGILRTTVAELCPWKELQPRAFSIMPLVYTIGAVFGPTLGGALANPLHQDPRKPHGSNFFERFPYAPPNMLAAALFAVGIITGFLFLKESHQVRKHDKDYGLILGAKMTAWVRKTFGISKPQRKTRNTEHEPLLSSKHPPGDEEATSGGLNATPNAKEDKKPGFKDVLSYQTTMNLVAYTLLALYSLAYDQLLPVFMHYPRHPVDAPPEALPFKFAKGFGIGNRRIGLIFTGFSVFCTLFQFLLFPPLARKLGVLTCLRISFLIYPIVYFITPFVALLPTSTSRELGMLGLMIIRGLAGTFSFPTSTILLTNSASSLQILGTLNGLATSISAIGRASGPAIGGSVFTWGVKKGYIVAPFWLLAAIALLASIPTWLIVEGKGFGDDPDSDAEDVQVVSASASTVSLLEEEQEEAGNPMNEDEAGQSESEYGEPTNLLTHTSTVSSAALASDEEFDSDEGDQAREHHGRRNTNSSLSGFRSRSQNRRRPVRKSSVPIGMGIGFRRLSSNLGSSGIGAGGASWGGT